MKTLFYPADWPTLTREIKEANGYVCLGCQRQCRRPGEMWLGWEYELSCAHICQDYEAEAVYVAALCLPCHLRFDAPHSWIARRRRNRLRQHIAGQLDIFPSK